VINVAEQKNEGNGKLPKLLIFVSICLLWMGLRNLSGVEFLMGREGITYLTLVWAVISLLEVAGSVLILYRKRISFYISVLALLFEIFIKIAVPPVWWLLLSGYIPHIDYLFHTFLLIFLTGILWIKRGYLKDELNPVAKEDAKKREENKRNLGVDILAAFFIGRGLVNLITLLYWGKPFDVSFLGDMSRIALESLFIIAGIGVYRREQWGFFLGMFVCAVAALMAADENWFKRWNNRALSFVMIVGLDRFRPYFKKVKKRDWVVAGVLILLFVGVYGYEKTRPSQADIQEYYTNLALENMDPSLCDNIQVRNHRESCYVDVNHVIQDPSLCDKLGDINMKDACFSDMAKSQKDISYCYKIKGDYSKNFCIKYVGRLTANENI